MPGEVPATSPIFAFGAIAKRVAFLMPCLTLLRNMSQLRAGSNFAESFFSANSLLRFFSNLEMVSIGTKPFDHPEPLKFL